ncbi:MAG: hypothetical protein IKK82_00450, partial [Kiritimatiellae bacterium]|nr:hypothetical protein [Kiritimatiellia bacterium]
WARGIVTDYSYDAWGSLTNTVYSDGTSTVTLLYDAMGRQTNAVDAAGVTTFAYDDYGSLTNETVVGAAGENTIIRHWDSFGRTAGYTLNNVRQTTIGYDPATGRIATMLANGSDIPFTWSYLPGSDLKSSLAYPNGLTASWTYDADGQLLQVRNATPTDVISQYDYTYDAAGRRTEIARSGTATSESRTDAYGYNVRNELISASKLGGSSSPTTEYAYQYDDIGNRITSTDLATNRTYTANNLNQYSAIMTSDSGLQTSSFTPQFDDDGNQTLIQTSTGIWSVQYNGENRPVLWTGGTQSAATNIVMSFDRMGRRVAYLETTGGAQSSTTETNAYHRFLYDNYLCIQRLDAANGNAVDLAFVWDATEPVATRPLIVDKPGVCKAYVTHDGNKNVTELISVDNEVVVHYEYSPFGGLLASIHTTSTLQANHRTDNPFQFSSEYSDDVIGLIYYNYRHYDAFFGRWLVRDPVFNFHSYGFVFNLPTIGADNLGLTQVRVGKRIENPDEPMEYRQAFTPVGLKDGCELNFIQIVCTFEGWEVDNKFGGVLPGGEAMLKPLGPYYTDWSQEGAAGYKFKGNGRIFYDRPTVKTWFYLFVVESCCLKKYKDSEKCNCCMESRATILHRIYWHTRKGKVMEGKVTDLIKRKMDMQLKQHVDGQSFSVPCEQYQKDNTGKKEAWGMPMKVEVDYGDVAH